MRPKLIAGAVVLVALLGSGAAAFFLVWSGWVPLPIGPVFDTAEGPAPKVVWPSSTLPAPASPAPAEESVGAVDPQLNSSQQPSFDIVRIEPTGEAVIAGRAEPGWKVTVEANQSEVAEVVADPHGEWTVVLDRPLAAGDHEITLKAMSPDGMKAVPSTQKVAAAVPFDARKKATVLMPSPIGAASPSDTMPRTAAVEPLGEQDKPDVYTILPGDTLWAIAKRYLGAGERYPAIFQKNREIIRNPDLIHPDERVKVPQDP